MKKILTLILIIISNLSGFGQAVIIEEPNKPAYYFSDGHAPSYYDGNAHLPAIITNQPQYDAVNDLVWLKNDKIKIGINLKRGGQIAWASRVGSNQNLIYNGYDGGFQVTSDSYEKEDGYTQEGQVSHSQPNNGGNITSYNVTHGGDFLNHAATLIDYHAIPNGYYVKLRPIFYTMNSLFSQTFIESTYTIIGNSVKINYKYTSFRTDGQWNGNGFDGAGAPAIFAINTLRKYKTYTGTNPWANQPLEDGNLPIENKDETINKPAEAPLGRNATEFFSMIYDPTKPNDCLAAYNSTDAVGSTFFTLKQLEVYAGNGPGTEFTGGFSFFQPFINYNITNRGNYVKDIECYLIVGSESEIRNRVYEIHGTPPSQSIQISASSTTISAGQSSTLTVSGCNSGLSWSDGGNANPRTVSPVSTTNYTVNCTNPVNSASAIVTVVPLTGGSDLTENGQASDDDASNPGPEVESKAFDNDQNTKWLVFNPTGNIVYDFAGENAFKVIKYSVTSANDEPARDPKNWNFQGSNDGTTWITVNSQTNQLFGYRFEKKEYSFTNLTAYKLYRLNVTANNGASLLQIAEIQMFGDAGGIENPPSNTDLTENGQAADDDANNPLNEGEIQAFDNNQNTKWLIFNSTGNISYDFNGNDAYKVVKYSITSANDDAGRDPKTWNFQGSNDGTTWITVNSQTNQFFSNRFEKKEYSFTNSTAYKLYRLNVTSNNGASLLQIAEIQMFGSSGTGTGGGGIDCPNPTLGNAVVFHWDVPTSTIWFAHRTTTGNMYVSTDANPATPALSHTQLRASGVAEPKIGCFLDGAKTRLSVVSLATNTLQPDDVTLSPNPNNGFFKVNINANAEKEVELLISNKSGKILLTRKVKVSQGSNSFDFKISEMEGLYILNVVDGNVRFNKQIAKIEEE